MFLNVYSKRCKRLFKLLVGSLYNQPHGSTQPSIPPGWVNGALACSAAVQAGRVHLCRVTRVAGNTVWSHMAGDARAGFPTRLTCCNVYDTCLYKELVADAWMVNVVHSRGEDNRKRLQISHHVLRQTDRDRQTDRHTPQVLPYTGTKVSFSH